MERKQYNGLDLIFVPIDGAEIFTSTTSDCEIVSVQYYVNVVGGSNCDTETPPEEGNPTLGYNYNWNSRPHN